MSSKTPAGDLAVDADTATASDKGAKQDKKKPKSPTFAVGRKISSATHAVAQAINETTQKRIVEPVKHVTGSHKKTDGPTTSKKDGDSPVGFTDPQPPDVARPTVPPDATLETKMDLIVNKKLHGLTIAQFYETIWKQPTLYRNWLKSTGKSDVQVQEWEIAQTETEEEPTIREANQNAAAAAKDSTESSTSDKSNSKTSQPSPSSLSYLATFATSVSNLATSQHGPPKDPSESTARGTEHLPQPLFVGEWCEEEYTQKRTVTFEFPRTTHLYTGPPIAHVTHTQWLRYDEDRCVLHMQVGMQDVPFSSTFNVQIRWVTTRTPDNGLQMQCGLHVYFKQAVMVAGKIRSGTYEETKPAQMSLFETMKEALNQVAGVEVKEEVDIYSDENDESVVGFEQEDLPPCFFCATWLTHAMRPKLGLQKQRLARQAYAAQIKMHHVLEISAKRQKRLQKQGGPSASISSEERKRQEQMQSELTDIHQSLDAILQLQKELIQKDEEEAKHASAW